MPTVSALTIEQIDAALGDFPDPFSQPDERLVGEFQQQSLRWMGQHILLLHKALELSRQVLAAHAAELPKCRHHSTPRRFCTDCIQAGTEAQNSKNLSDGGVPVSKYRKKPLVIDAIITDAISWCAGSTSDRNFGRKLRDHIEQAMSQARAEAIEEIIRYHAAEYDRNMNRGDYPMPETDKRVWYAAARAHDLSIQNIRNLAQTKPATTESESDEKTN